MGLRAFVSLTVLFWALPLSAQSGGAVAARPMTGTVPATAPDSVPLSVWAELMAPSNILNWPAGFSSHIIRDALFVFFKPTATRSDRQAAIDLVGGRVLGGVQIGPEGGYVIRIPYVLTAGDSVSGPVLRAMQTLNSIPSVDGAVIIPTDKLTTNYRKGTSQAGSVRQLPVVPGDSAAQSRCGASTPYFADRLFTAYFTPTDSLTERFRKSLGIARQLPTAPHGMVTDAAVCRKLKIAVLKQVGDVGEQTDSTNEGSNLAAMYWFYRLGDYYGVAYRPPQKGTVRVRGAGPVYIFAVQDLRYMGKIYD